MIAKTLKHLAFSLLLLDSTSEGVTAQSVLQNCPNVPYTSYNNCFGVFTNGKGDIYFGEWKNGMLHGQGTLVSSTGEKYVGQFKDNKAEGQGTYTFVTGEKYVGQFQDNKPNGRGVHYASDGSILEQGIFQNSTLTQSESSAPLPSSNYHRVQMVKEGGTYAVPVFINNVLSLNFVVDSGAADVTIPADVAGTLIRTGTIADGDFIGHQQYTLADGSVINSRQFLIRSLKVGDQVIENVRGSIGDVKGSLLLGQSFLERFKSWSMDNTKHELVLE